MLTERYRNSGYFLSRAYVPPQEIEGGAVTIKVVEGYIGTIELTDPAVENDLIQRMTRRIVGKKPLRISEIESFILRLNDLPGVSFRAIMEPLEAPGLDEGAVKLVLARRMKEAKGSLSFSNYGSRFLGPYQTTASYQASLLPRQQTTFTGLVSTPTDELRYAAVSHDIAVFPGLVMQLDGDYSTAHPGYLLERNDIESQSINLGVKLTYQVIRQRQENLMAHVGFEGRNTDSDAFSIPLTRDRTRAVRAGVIYDMADGWGGYDVVDLTLSQGLALLGASRQGDLDLSRAEAKPDFRKAELSLTRQQVLGTDWALVTSAAGQFASGALYSSEEFGYGGLAFGRAYDASEITGDHGLAGAVEVRYMGVDIGAPVRLVPYAFYDIGKIWNVDAGQEKQASGSSAGLGMRFDLLWGFSGTLGLAQPLTRAASAPLYGEGKAPRLLLEMQWSWP